MNQTLLVMIMAGLLLSMSAGVRTTLPLLAINLLAFHHVVTLPAKMAWLGTEPTLVLLGVAFIAETLVHFVPVVGTAMRTVSTPLAFAAGTLVMAIPLADQSPLTQWALAGFTGGGLALLTHVGVTGARTLSSPANLASGGLFGLFWNLGELVFSALLTLLGFFCVVMGWVAGLILLLLLAGAMIVFALQSRAIFRNRWMRRSSLP